jgi:hypothetical protein
MSTDPLAGDIGNPQSLNLYAYVRNNPASLVDPLGLRCTQADRAAGGCSNMLDRALARIGQLEARFARNSYAYPGAGTCTMNGFQTSCGTVD